MSNSIIKVENLSKSYIISHEGQQQGYSAMRDVITQKAKKIFSFSQSKLQRRPSNSEEFFALKDLNFEIKQGDRVGIIGSNGAGKSTLLKVLSRITEPTSGRITINGRVASLLEVGTGFHPELTGRENIYLNGAILGMSRSEIKRKFDEIVDFSEVERFLDTPVKRYSSGMYVRLAFAVAAHLEPEILIVDEVLAVGDAQFQKKCLGKMEDVSKNEGRTILFVSHNMAAIRSLCNDGIFLINGELKTKDRIENCIIQYEKKLNINFQSKWINDEINNQEVYLESITVLNNDNNQTTNFLNSETITVRFTLIINENVNNLKVGFDLISKGNVVFRTQQIDSTVFDKFNKGELIIFECKIPEWYLNVGEYFIRPLISIHMVKPLSKVGDPILSFNVSIDSSKTFYHSVLTQDNHPGLVFPILEWIKP
jgi:lipopolysaccharide transport system ATP-binding protein